MKSCSISEKSYYTVERREEPHLNSNSFSWLCPRPKDFIKLCFVATWISRNSRRRLEARTGCEASNLGLNSFGGQETIEAASQKVESVANVHGMDLATPPKVTQIEIFYGLHRWSFCFYLCQQWIRYFVFIW